MSLRIRYHAVARDRQIVDHFGFNGLPLRIRLLAVAKDGQIVKLC